jgi:hypothetical protein
MKTKKQKTTINYLQDMGANGEISKIIEKQLGMPSAEEMMNLGKSPAWVSEIEAICNKEGITPGDMIKQWEEMKEKVKLFQKNREKSKGFIEKNKDSDLIKDIAQMSEKALEKKGGLSKWQLELRKKKLGI